MQIVRRSLFWLMVVGGLALALIGLTALIRLFVDHSAISAEIAAAVVVLALLARSAVARLAPGVSARTVLELDLPSAPEEVVGRSPVGALTGRRALTLSETVSTIARASRDSRVRGMIVRPRFGAAPQAVVEELRDAVSAFAETGKFTVAVTDSFGEGGPSNGAYFLATACNEVAVHPTGLVGWAPMSIERNFYRGLLDRLGVEVEVLARQEFKSAFNRLSQREFTGPDREQSQRLLDSLWGRQVEQVAQARHLDPQQVRHLADTAPILAAEALEAGLVDRLAYTDEVVAEAKDAAGPKAKLLYLSAYRKKAGRPRRRDKSAPVGILRAVGEIQRTSALPFGFGGGPVLAADKLVPQIRAAAKQKKVKAFVLRIDSPGGSAVASDAIWRELVRLRDAGKRLVVSMGAVAASGGYYLAVAADRVVAQPGTVTGSIGVITLHPVLSGAKAKLDVTADEVHTGAEPSMFSVNHPLSPSQRQRTNLQLDRTYKVFTERVAAGRGLPIEKVLDVAKGRVWSGADAVSLGLVDELGGLERAMALALELSGEPPGTRARPKRIPPRPGPLARVRPREPISSDDLPAAAGVGGKLAFAVGGEARAQAAAIFSGHQVMLHLGWDPRNYWLP
ncbi:MAG TPA: signal peptide peptidase SppA [Acidimicrobiales bacterium]|nr:signal peptide peptidase SppA [Acidimicrobiales bacterium]